ncbi:EamA family transporter, partial [Vibrio furnissii]
LLWMSVVVSTGALLLLMLMLKHQSASQVSVLFYCIPVLTILFDYALFGTTLSVMSWVG